MKKFIVTILTIVLVLAVLGGAGFAIYKYVVPLIKDKLPSEEPPYFDIDTDTEDPAPQGCQHIEGRTEFVVEFTPLLYMFGIDDSLASQGLVPIPEGWDYFRGYGFTNFVTVDDVPYTFHMMFKDNNAGLDFLDEDGNVIAEYDGSVADVNALQNIVVNFALGDVEVCGISFVSADGAHHTFNVNYTVPNGQCILCGEAINSEG